MARKPTEEAGINMTPMIDVVFQLIIFFVTTADLDRKAFDMKIKLAMAPHGPAVEKKDPRTVVIEITDTGTIKLGEVPMSAGAVKAVMNKVRNQFGQDTPVVIRADAKTQHKDVRACMDAVTGAGLYVIKFSATKELAKKAGES